MTKEELEKLIPLPQSNQRNFVLADGGIDAGLMLLTAVTPAGHERTLDEIAFVCGCERKIIWQIESRALQKLKRRLEQKRSEGLI